MKNTYEIIEQLCKIHGVSVKQLAQISKLSIEKNNHLIKGCLNIKILDALSKIFSIDLIYISNVINIIDEPEKQREDRLILELLKYKEEKNYYPHSALKFQIPNWEQLQKDVCLNNLEVMLIELMYGFYDKKIKSYEEIKKYLELKNERIEIDDLKQSYKNTIEKLSLYIEKQKENTTKISVKPDKCKSIIFRKNLEPIDLNNHYMTKKIKAVGFDTLQEVEEAILHLPIEHQDLAYKYYILNKTKKRLLVEDDYIISVLEKNIKMIKKELSIISKKNKEVYKLLTIYNPSMSKFDIKIPKITRCHNRKMNTLNNPNEHDLYIAILKLPHQYQQLALEYYFYNKTSNQIMIEQNISISAISSALQKILSMLKENLSQNKKSL